MFPTKRKLTFFELMGLAAILAFLASYLPASSVYGETISGTVTRDSLTVETADTFVLIFDRVSILTGIEPVATVLIPDPGVGTYEFTGLVIDRSYYLLCWMDADDDGALTRAYVGPPMDPIGVLGSYDGMQAPVVDSLYLSGDTTGIHLTLVSPLESAHYPGSIGGRVDLVGLTRPTDIAVGLFADGGLTQPLYVQALEEPGPYTVHSVPDGTYYVGAFLDTNGNGEADSGEIRRAYNPADESDGAPVEVAGAAVSGIDIELRINPNVTRETSWSVIKASYR